MSFLAVQVQEFLETSPLNARQLEDSAGLQRMTIGNILNDTHPRPERFGQLLRAVDDTTARRWLIAYLRDDCPPEFLPRLEIVVRDQEGTQRESAAAYASTTEHGPAAVLASWQRLQAAIEADISLGRWFIKTVSLILGPVTPPTAVDAHLAEAARQFEAEQRQRALPPARSTAPRSGGAPPQISMPEDVNPEVKEHAPSAGFSG